MLEVNAEAQRRKHRAEIQALQSQINPHFIVNTLNSIRFMAQVAGYAGIQKMAESLMKIVSCSFRSNISFYTLREELDVLDSYVYLMRIRYADSFEVSYDIAEDCLDYMLPRLLLQPVVENSITHGFAEMEEELGQIDVTARRKGEMLCLIVRDNGCGMSQEQIEQILHGHAQTVDDNTSIGLKNVLARIRLNFGGKAQMEITSEPQKYTQTVIRLPWKEEKQMIRTLIVDDETLVRATLRTLVDWEALGYTIVQDCSDGGQALEYLKRNPVDVMFTDMKMPNVGGIELLRGLKESRAAPVSIALSGYDEFELVREAFRLGAYDYL